jgi:hypothetical protein
MRIDQPSVTEGKCQGTRFRWMSVSPGQQETISVDQFYEIICYVKLQIGVEHDPEQITVEVSQSAFQVILVYFFIVTLFRHQFDANLHQLGIPGP